jgi:bacterial/archaeal transporter family protein
MRFLKYGSRIIDMNWMFYALGSAVFAALVAIFGKIGLKNIDSTLATTVRAVVMALFLVIVAFSLNKFKGLESITGKPLLFIVLSGVAGALSWLFYFFAIKNGPVSGVVAIDRTSVVFALVLAALFLGESFTVKTALGGALILGGALLVAL